MRLIDMFSYDDDTPEPEPEPTPIPATFLAQPDDAPLLPAAARTTTRPAPAFATTMPTTPAHARPKQREAATPKRAPRWIDNNPGIAARELGEAVAEAWHSANGGSQIEIPIGIVAALALFPIKDHTDDVYHIISTCTDWELIQGYREIWAHQWSRHPDLIAHAAPFMEWLGRDDAMKLIRPVRAVTDTALNYGILSLTESSDPYSRSSADVMAYTIAELRSTKARQGQGEYYTPPELCEMMARVVYDKDTPPEPGEGFNDPCAGTGGMFRALSQLLREWGLDPAAYGWSMQDIDPIACAAAAVNAIVWDLGPNVLISCVNSLAQGNPDHEAAQRRKALIEERDEILSKLAVATAFQEAIVLADSLIRDKATA